MSGITTSLTAGAVPPLDGVPAHFLAHELHALAPNPITWTTPFVIASNAGGVQAERLEGGSKPPVKPRVLNDQPDWDVRAVTANYRASDFLAIDERGGLSVIPSVAETLGTLADAARTRFAESGVSMASFRFALGGNLDEVAARVADLAGIPLTAAWRRIGDLCAAFATHLSKASASTVFFLLSISAIDNNERTRLALAAVPDLIAHDVCFVNIVVCRAPQVADAGVLDLVAGTVLDLGLKGAQVAVSARAEATPFFPANDPTTSGVVMLAISHVEPLRAGVLAAMSDAPGDRNAAYRALSETQSQILTYVGALGASIAARAKLTFAGVDLIPGPVHYPGAPSRRSLIGLGELLAGKRFVSGTIQEVLTPFIASLRAGAVASGYLRPGYQAGIFTAVSEDGVLAERVRSGGIGIGDLHQAAAVSACGPDMVVVHPSTTREQLSQALKSTALIADRLHKPLACRFIRPARDARPDSSGDYRLGHVLLGAAPALRLPGPSSDAQPLSSLNG